MYADADFYKNTFGGTVIPDAQIVSYLSKASDDIDALTYNRIPYYQVKNQITDFQLSQIKKAECYQAEYLFNYGDMITMPLSGYSVTDYTVNLNTGISPFDKKAVRCLLSTGLMNRRLI